MSFIHFIRGGVIGHGSEDVLCKQSAPCHFRAVRCLCLVTVLTTAVRLSANTVMESENILLGPESNFSMPEPWMSLGQFLFERLTKHKDDFVLQYETKTGRRVTSLESISLIMKLQFESETGRRVTSRELMSLSMMAAEGLRRFGVCQGDVVVLIGRTGIDISSAALASLLLGATACPIDPAMTTYEFAYILKLTNPTIVICDAEVAQVVLQALDEVGDRPVIVVKAGKQSPHTRYEDILVDVAFEDFRIAAVENNSKSRAFIVCSSGTTGFPKGVEISDRSLICQILQHNKESSPGARATVLQTSHFFWISGIILLCSGIYVGNTQVLVSNVNDTNILMAIHNFRPGVAILTPSRINSLVKNPNFNTYDVSSVQLIITGGSALQPATIHSLQTVWDPNITCSQLYGLTEVSGICTIGTDKDLYSVGTPGFDCKYKFADTSDGRTVGPMEEGEILIHSPTVMLGYTNNEEATKEMIDDEGWVHTGDIGYHTEDKLIYISGRIKEFIKYQNLQIAPAELEHVIFAVPGVLDVGVAGVAVNADTYYPMALVVREDEGSVTEEDVMKAVNDNLSDYKRLRGGVVFVDAIPRTPSGKIRRQQLKLMAKDLYLNEPL